MTSPSDRGVEEGRRGCAMKSGERREVGVGWGENQKNRWRYNGLRASPVDGELCRDWQGASLWAWKACMVELIHSWACVCACTCMCMHACDVSGQFTSNHQRLFYWPLPLPNSCIIKMSYTPLRLCCYLWQSQHNARTHTLACTLTHTFNIWTGTHGILGTCLKTACINYAHRAVRWNGGAAMSDEGGGGKFCEKAR